jgi:adenosine deaminase
MHLEGALSPALLFSLASKNNIALPADPAYSSPAALESRYAQRFANLQDFLDLYFLGLSVLIEGADFEALAWSYFQVAREQGVLHAELSFDPQAHADRGVPLAIVTNAIARACHRANTELGMTTRLIMCFLRHLPTSSALETLESARPLLLQGQIHGIGLDSTELDFPPTPFAAVYAKAADAGFRLTAHAGEEANHTYIHDALTHLGAERIDHGIRLAENVELMTRVAAAGTLLTVCPLSNLHLKCVTSVTDLPIRTFLDHGVSFSINSDDPAYFGGYILDNYVLVQDAFGLSVEEWGVIGRASIEGSWIEEGRKRELLGSLEDLLKKFEGVPPHEL